MSVISRDLVSIDCLLLPSISARSLNSRSDEADVAFDDRSALETLFNGIGLTSTGFLFSSFQ